MAFFDLFFPDYNDEARGYEYWCFGTAGKLLVEEFREEHPTRGHSLSI